jgi:hypothetical protein
MNCECCGKLVESRDNFALHTACMRNHHLHLMGERSSRCKSGVKRTTTPYEKLPEDWTGPGIIATALDWDLWYAEAKRVRLEGKISRAGILGTSCPRCYRQVRHHPELDYAEQWCHCDDQIADVRDENAAHGVPVTIGRSHKPGFTAV